MKTNKIFSAFGIILLVASIVSCQQEELTAPTDAKHTPMTFDITHPSSASRATATSFEDGDKVGLYVALADVPLEIGGQLVNNECLTFNGNKWNATRQLYWDEGTYTAYAYYPYRSTISSTVDLPFSVSLDQSAPETGEQLGGYEASDFLFACAKGISVSNTSVTLPFKHIMSKLTIRLVKGDDYEGEIPTDAEVYIHNTIPDATIDLAEGVATYNYRSSAKTIRAQQTGDTQYSAIIVPQRLNNNQPLVEVLMKGVSYLYESRFVFKNGVNHTVNLVVSDNPDNIKIEIGGEVADW